MNQRREFLHGFSFSLILFGCGTTYHRHLIPTRAGFIKCFHSCEIYTLENFVGSVPKKELAGPNKRAMASEISNSTRSLPLEFNFYFGLVWFGTAIHIFSFYFLTLVFFFLPP